MNLTPISTSSLARRRAGGAGTECMSLAHHEDATETSPCIIPDIPDTPAPSFTATLTFFERLVPNFQSAPFMAAPLPASVVVARGLDPLSGYSAADSRGDAGPR